MTRSFSIPAAGLVLAAGLSTTAAADTVSVLVFDASGSMWNRVEGDLTRIEVARDVMGDYFASRDGAVPLSVIAYGHNRRGDCTDIEVVAPMGSAAPSALEARLRGLMPRGMTPLTDSLRLARDQIPPTAEAADIILVTDGLETCEGDPCALAAELAAEGIDIRAHVVGFGLSRVEVEALSCITDQTGGMLFQTNSGAELADALRQVSTAPPPPQPQPDPEPEPAPPEAAFDIGDKAEAGFTYTITWRGEASSTAYLGFVLQGENGAPSSSGFNTINIMSDGGPRNPVTRTAPKEPGMYDLIIREPGGIITARQAVEVVPPAMGFDPVGSVEPGSRLRVTFRAPEQLGERIVIADLDQPVGEHQRHGWDNALAAKGATTLTAPPDPGEYELRYLNSGATEILFSRRFGVGIPFEDADLTTSGDLAAQAAAATQGDAAQDNIASVPATFRLPPGLPGGEATWQAIPLDPDMQPEAWAPMDSGTVITGEFEPGNWRVSAHAPGAVDLTLDVAIFPGQANDFTLPLPDFGLDGALEGSWTIWAIPPREVADPPMAMAEVDLRLTEERQDYTGSFTTEPAMGGQVVAGDLTAVIIEFDNLYITLPLPQVAPDPFVLSLAPQGAGYVGTMASGPNSLPVAFWPAGAAADLPLWQDAAYGPAAGDAAPSDIAFTCAEPSCDVVIDGLGLSLPQGWSMTPPDWVSATAGAHPLENPRVDFYGPGRESLHLNPHQWLADNGPCMPTGAGQLCLWRDGPPEAAGAAVPLALSLRLEPREDARHEPAAQEFRGLGIELPGVPMDARIVLDIRVVEGEDAMGDIRREGQMQMLRDPYRIGNVYDLRAEYQGREYRNPRVEIVPGPGAQIVRLAGQYLSTDFAISADPPPAGTPGWFPVTVTAPEGFDGSFALHSDLDRDGAPLFATGAADWLGAQDQVLPVPELPGEYELRYLDADGGMIGAALIVVPGGEGEGADPGEDSGSMAIEPDDGVRFAGLGPYLAGAEVMVQVSRGPSVRPGDTVVLLGPGSDLPLPDTGFWLDDFRASLRMPEEPGEYTLAILDAEASSLRALTPAKVETAPQPAFWRYNPNPVPVRPYTVMVTGRVAMADRIAIVTPTGERVVEAELYEALTGQMRLPEGALGAHELHYLAEGGVLLRAALDVGGPPPLAPAGGSDGPAEITMHGEMAPGGTVQVALRGMIPPQSIVGFIRAGSPDRSILQTGSNATPDKPVAEVKVPEGEGPWALRLVDPNLIRVAEIVPGRAGGSPPASALIPARPAAGVSPADVLDFLLPGFAQE